MIKIYFDSIGARTNLFRKSNELRSDGTPEFQDIVSIVGAEIIRRFEEEHKHRDLETIFSGGTTSIAGATRVHISYDGNPVHICDLRLQKPFYETEDSFVAIYIPSEESKNMIERIVDRSERSWSASGFVETDYTKNKPKSL